MTAFTTSVKLQKHLWLNRHGFLLDHPYFPLPVPAVTRPWGADCSACGGFCGRQYLEPEDTWKYIQEKGTDVCQTKPPSVVLQNTFNSSEKKGEDLLENGSGLKDIAKYVLSTPNEVKICIEHLKGIKSRRQQGAKKAAATRATKKVHEFISYTILNYHF